MDKKYREPDIFKKIDKILNNRGDSKKPDFVESSNQKPDEPGSGDLKPVKNVCKLKNTEKDRQNVMVIDNRRRIREKYTIHMRDRQNVTNLGKIDKSEAAKSTGEVYKSSIQINGETKVTAPTETSVKTDKEPVLRKPVVKTVTLKKDTTRVYKAVTFIDQRKPTARINIKLPTGHKNTNNYEFNKTKTISVSRMSVKTVKGKPVNRTLDRNGNLSRKKYTNRRNNSPLSSPVRNNPSPITEVAKWAPTSITQDTKPYYEAWVNTTLAAISNDSDFLLKEDIIKKFQKTLETKKPEPFYEDYSNEMFTGRIKVKRKY